MQRKHITFSIPTKNGVEQFSLSRKAVWAFLLFIATSPAVAVYFYQQHISSQEYVEVQVDKMTRNFDAAQQQIAYLDEKSEQFRTLYESEVISNHTLASELEDKNSQIVSLGQRVNDVESVLGLGETPIDEQSLEARIDAAAVDSAVRTTLFRLLPNQTPMSYQRISSDYGYRRHPVTGKRHFHRGYDMTCQIGEPVFAPADGVVEFTRPSNKGYGNYLKLRHSFGFMTAYAHLSKFKVRSGQFVSKGDLIALCGNTGTSTGPHLHYEVRFLGRTLNPANFIQWGPESFEELFEKEQSIKWQSLLAIVNKVVQQQVLLTKQQDAKEVTLPDTASN
ncbi:M23 family metallopeptidase [Vibrio sp. SCSIO 43136]|uniref:M23 family metallopeptidase n=1 Tax=Vibrio sp. SCSIO 43136 TaxID=2819101 RepID=UPI00207504C7|nr:M23 family metallopeptidase [Vibrio sp. SCSIO 43136]USD64823.1 M23 family metallopeptidase [Vibrio sp. SCSIO 43136]